MKIVVALLSTALLAAGVPAHAADGTLDTAFGDDGVARVGVNNLYDSYTSTPTIDANGAIAWCSTMQGADDRDMLVARVRADGSPDATFSGDGRLIIDVGGNNDECYAMLRQPDGKLLVAGSSAGSSVGATDQSMMLVRLLPNGIPDISFGVNGKALLQFDVLGAHGAAARAIALLADGRIVAAGTIYMDGSADLHFGVARLLPDGSYDPAFNGNGRQLVDFSTGGASDSASGYAMAIDPSGRIVIGGRAKGVERPAFAAARLLATGQLDTSFGDGGKAIIAVDPGGAGSGRDAAQALAIQPDGRVVLAGTTDVSLTSTPNVDMAIVRLDANGHPDASFGTGGIVVVPFDRMPSGTDTALAVLVDRGRLLVGGYAIGHDGTGAEIALVRLRGDGSRDPSFGTLGRRTLDLHVTSPGIQLVAGLVRIGGTVFASGLVAPTSTPGQADTFVIALEYGDLLRNGFDP